MKKLITLALACSVSLLAMTAQACAMPFAPFLNIGFALWGGAIGAALPFVSPVAFAVGLQVAAYAAVLGAQLALSARQQPKIDPGELKNTFQEAESSEYNAIGRVRLGGLKAFGNTKGSFISRLVWHCKGPLDGIEEYHVGGRPVTVDPDGTVSSPPWATSSGSYLNIQSKPGNGNETAWPSLMNDFPTIWTAAHRARGIFQSLARYRVPSLDTESGNKRFQKLYQGGAPDITVTARVTPVYDPRDPGQDPDNSATWEWSDNGILAAAHIMRAYPDLTSADFDWTFLATEADRADALVATLTGTEPRARCWGVWPSESRRGETMQQVLDSIGAEVVLSDEGLIRIRLIDDAPASEITFTDKQIPELNWRSGPEAVERPNVCRITYYSPERGYDMGEINMTGIGWARVEEEIARYGEKIFDVELPFCPSAAQAQRIARRLFLQSRADAGSIRTNMSGLCAWGVTYAGVEDSDAEETMLCRLAPPRIDDEQGQVDIPFIVWPAALIDSPWNPATMEAPAPEQVPDLNYESDIGKPTIFEACVVQYPGGSRETRVRYSSASNGSTAEANFRTYSGGLPNPWTSMTETSANSRYFAWNSQDTLGQHVDFRVRWANGEDVGYFSDVFTIDPAGINNNVPTAPSVNAQPYHPPGLPDAIGGVVLTITALDVQDVRATVQYSNHPQGPWTTWTTLNDIRPAVSRVVTMDGFGFSEGYSTLYWRVSLSTSNNTQGPFASGSQNITVS